MEQVGSVLRARLDNGLTVLLQENHRAPVVAIQIWVDVGSADETALERGMAHLHEHMLFKGTRKRPVGQIAKDIESAGGEINAWTSFDQTVYHVVLASRYLDLGLDVLSDAVSNSSFDTGELDREKQVILEEIKRSHDLPGRRISDVLFREAYRTHSYRHPILGTAASVGKITRKDLVSFFRRHYTPANMTLLVVGDMNPGATLRKIQRLFPKKRRQVKPDKQRTVEPAQRKLRLKVIEDEITEAHFQLGWHIPAVGDTTIPALDLLSVIMGQGESSRLNLGLKHGLNLANDIYAYTYTPKDPGLFVIGGSCSAEKIPEVLCGIGNQLELLTSTPVTIAEINKAKTMIESEVLYHQETVEGIARRLGYHQALMGDPSYGETYLRQVLAVTPEDIKKVVSGFLVSRNLTAAFLVPRVKTGQLTPSRLRKELTKSRTSRSDSALSAEIPNSVTRIKIKNGPVVLIQEDHSNAIVSVRAVFLGGTRYETEANNGTNNLLAGLVTRGTKNYSAEEIAMEVDALAGVIEGFSGRNTFGLRADFPSRHFERSFSLFTECLLHPTFPEKEIKRERELILEEIRSREDNLAGLAFDLFASTLFKSHPYRLPLIGTRQSVVGLKRRQIKDYWSTHFTPDRLVLSIVGDVDEKRVVKQIRGLFAKAPGVRPAPPPTIPLEPRPAGVRTAARIRAREQSHIVLGFMGTTLSSNDRHALEVLLAVLAGQGGRLFVEVEDQLSLAYAISGFSLEGIEPGYIAVYLATDPGRAKEAIDAIMKRLRLVRDKRIDAAELNRAQRYLVGTHAISLQRASSRAAALAFNELYGLGHLDYLRYPEHILAVTSDDVRRVARKYLKLDSYSLVVVGPEQP